MMFIKETQQAIVDADITPSNESMPGESAEIKPTDLGKSANLIRRCFSDIQSCPINWLWDGLLALGKLAIIAGDPGVGKSQITASLAAMVSVGDGWPGGKGLSLPSRVAFLSAEDSAEDTIKPRLIAAGADLSKIDFIDGINEKNGEKNCVDLSKNINELNLYLTENPNIRLLVIDPISAYLGKIDSHKDGDVRRILHPLSKLAENHRVTIICIAHLNKNTAITSIGRITGSIGFIASVRMAYMVGRDPQNQERCLFVPIKNNVGTATHGFSFTIESIEINKDIKISKIKWGERIKARADDVFNQVRIPSAKKLNKAAVFLTGLLANGPLEAKNIYAQAHARGFSDATLERAKLEIGVESIKQGLSSRWLWKLPEVLQNEDLL